MELTTREQEVKDLGPLPAKHFSQMQDDKVKAEYDLEQARKALKQAEQAHAHLIKIGLPADGHEGPRDILQEAAPQLLMRMITASGPTASSHTHEEKSPSQASSHAEPQPLTRSVRATTQPATASIRTGTQPTMAAGSAAARVVASPVAAWARGGSCWRRLTSSAPPCR